MHTDLCYCSVSCRYVMEISASEGWNFTLAVTHFTNFMISGACWYCAIHL